MPSYRAQTVLHICNYTFSKLKAKSYWCYWISIDRVATERTTWHKKERDDSELWSVSRINYVNTSFILCIRQDQTFHPSEMTSSHLTSHICLTDAGVQCTHKHGYSDNSAADILPPDFIHHWMLYSIYLIKSLCAERVPSAEAEFGLSKHLRHSMSDGFMEKGITAANKQPLRCWYLQSECYAALQSAWVTVLPQKLGQNISEQFHKKVKCEVTGLPRNALMNSEGPSWPWAEGTHLGIDLEILEIRSKQENLDGNLFFISDS